MSEFVIDGDDAAATHHNNFEFEASVDSENLRSLDDRINCKIAAGMKKAIHLIVQRFDNLFQQKLKMLAQAEVDARIKEIKELVANLNTDAVAELEAKLIGEDSPEKQTINTQNVENKQSIVSQDDKPAPLAILEPKQQQNDQQQQQQITKSTEIHQQKIQSFEEKQQTQQPLEKKIIEKAPINNQQQATNKRSNSVQKVKNSVEGKEKTVAAKTDKNTTSGQEMDSQNTSKLNQKPAASTRTARESKKTNRESKTKASPRPNDTKPSAKKQQVQQQASCSSSVTPRNIENSFKKTKSIHKNEKHKTVKHQSEKKTTSKISRAATSSAIKKFQIPDDTQQEEQNANLQCNEVPIGHLLEQKEQSKLKFSQDKKQVSTATDVIDPIYKESDPIDMSIQMRKKKGGRVTSVSRDAPKASGKYFYTLKLKQPVENQEDKSSYIPKTRSELIKQDNNLSNGQIQNQHDISDQSISTIKTGNKSRHRRNVSLHPSNSQTFNFSNPFSQQFNQEKVTHSPSKSFVASPPRKLPESVKQDGGSSQKWGDLLLVKYAENAKEKEMQGMLGYNNRNEYINSQQDDELVIGDGNESNEPATPENAVIQKTLQSIIQKQENTTKVCSPLSADVVNLENDESKNHNHVDDEDDETINWPPSVQSSNVRPNITERQFNQIQQTDKSLKEFEKIERSISDSSCVFELDTSKKTKRDESSMFEKKSIMTKEDEIQEINQLILSNQRLMRIPNVNPQILTTQMKPVRFKRGDQIVKYGQQSFCFFILAKGKIKITEYEPGTNPLDPNIENQISLEKFVNEKGFSFGQLPGEQNQLQQASINVVDEFCDFYMLENYQENAKLDTSQLDQEIIENNLSAFQIIKKIIELPQQEKLRLRKQYPSRNAFQMDNGIQVSSCFDAGNLSKCVLNSVKKTGIYHVLYNFDLWLSPDSHPYLTNIQQGRVGFFFSITGIPDKASESQVARKLKFKLNNLCETSNLMNQGHMPVYLETNKENYEQLINGQMPFYKQDWKRINGDFKVRKGKNGVESEFELVINGHIKKTDYILFAQTYPFNFNDVLYSVKEAEKKCQTNEEIYFESRELVRTLEGRPLHLLTICSKQALQNQKNVIFLTGRVHSGEAPSSYMIQGIIDKLLDFKDPHSQKLLDNYIFKIIPMLNPDGVSRGYWKFDTLGQNLNNFYKDPQKELHPTIWATKNAVVQEHKSGRLKMYVDFHARSSKKGAFIQDNSVNGGEPINSSSQYPQCLESMMIPKLMSLNCVNFDFRECSFSQVLTESIDGQLVKQSRSAMFMGINNPFTYTLDINYSFGHRTNNLAWRYDVQNDRKLLKEDMAVQDTSSQLYKGQKTPIFCPKIYSDVGASLLTAMLDYDQMNPITRLVYQSGQQFQTVLDEIRKELQRGKETTQVQGRMRSESTKHVTFQKREVSKEQVNRRDTRNVSPVLNREQRIKMIRCRSGMRTQQNKITKQQGIQKNNAKQ